MEISSALRSQQESSPHTHTVGKAIIIYQLKYKSIVRIISHFFIISVNLLCHLQKQIYEWNERRWKKKLSQTINR